LYDGYAPFDVGGVDKSTEVSAMSRRTLNTDDELGFIKAYRDEILDTCAMYGVEITVDLRVQEGKPGLKIVLFARGVDGRPLAGKLIVVDYHYPTTTATRLHAGLYQAAIRLNVAVQNAHRDETGSYMSDATDEAAQAT